MIRTGSPLFLLISFVGIASLTTILIFIIIGSTITYYTSNAALLSKYEQTTCILTNFSIYNISNLYLPVWNKGNVPFVLESPYSLRSSFEYINNYPFNISIPCYCTNEIMDFKIIAFNVYGNCFLNTLLILDLQFEINLYIIGSSITFVGYLALGISLFISIIILAYFGINKYRTKRYTELG